MLPRNSQALFLVQRIRDEAHRFAITYHRKVRSKKGFRSALDEVPGIGPKRKQALIKQFGTRECHPRGQPGGAAGGPRHDPPGRREGEGAALVAKRTSIRGTAAGLGLAWLGALFAVKWREDDFVDDMWRTLEALGEPGRRLHRGDGGRPAGPGPALLPPLHQARHPPGIQAPLALHRQHPHRPERPLDAPLGGADRGEAPGLRVEGQGADGPDLPRPGPTTTWTATAG